MSFFALTVLISANVLASGDPWLSLRREEPYPPFGQQPHDGIVAQIWPDGRIERSTDARYPNDKIEQGYLSASDFADLKLRFDAAWKKKFESQCSLSPDGAFQKLSITIDGHYSFFQCNVPEQPMDELNSWLWKLSIHQGSSDGTAEN